MNPDTGVIRQLNPRELPVPRELELSEVEAKVLEGYQAKFRPELLRRWRAGKLELRVTNEGGRLHDVESNTQRRIRQTVEGWKAKKARRRIRAESKRKQR